MRTLRFFKNRIGERIYRDKDTCKCKTCVDVAVNGLVVNNELHAEYLYAIQCDFYADGTDLNYRDKF